MEHFVAAGVRVESVHLNKIPEQCYGTIKFRPIKGINAIIKANDSIRGTPIEFSGQPGVPVRHNAQEYREQASAAPIMWFNDDCFGKLFNHLVAIDLCSITAVCHRFKANTDSRFSSKFKTLEFDDFVQKTPQPSVRQFSYVKWVCCFTLHQGTSQS